MINNCLQKLDMTSTPGIFILPLWPTQPWLTRALQMLVATPFLLPQRMDLLRLPNSPSCHPLANETDDLKIVKQSYRARGLSTGATSIILARWIDGSKKQYSSQYNPLVVRFLQGVYNSRPSLPRYTEIWDVIVLVNEMLPASTLALKELTYKFVMLIALVSAQFSKRTNYPLAKY